MTSELIRRGVANDTARRILREKRCTIVRGDRFFRSHQLLVEYGRTLWLNYNATKRTLKPDDDGGPTLSA